MGHLGRLIGRTKGGLTTRLHAVADANRRPLSFVMTADQISDYTGESALLDDLPRAQRPVCDHGYDAELFRNVLQAKSIHPCPGQRFSNEPVRYDKRRYRRRGRIEIMFDRLKDWRRAAMRYDHCPTAYISAVTLTF